MDHADADALTLAACEPAMRRVHRAWRDRAARHATDGAALVHARATADALAVAAVLQLQALLRPVAIAAVASRGGRASLDVVLPHLPGFLDRRAALERDAGLEVLDRLAADGTTIRRVEPAGLGPVVAIDAAGDAHAGARRTLLLRDADGRGIALKPRSLAPDLGVDAVLAELAPAVPPLGAARLPPTVDLGGHGWQRLVAGASTAERDAPELFASVGALLAVLHVLRVGDLHADNLVVAGARPVPIDLECVLQPALGGPGANPERDATEVGLLPHRDPVHGRDLSPVGAWLAAHEPAPERLRDVLVPALERGLDDAWSAVEALAEDDDRVTRLQRRFAAADVRVVARPTLAYAGLLAEAVTTGTLGAPGGTALRARLTPSARRPDLAGLVAFEAADLADGDLPRFVGRPGARSLRHRRGVAEHALRAGPIPTLRTALAERRRPDPAVVRGAFRPSPSFPGDHAAAQAVVPVASLLPTP